VLDEKLRDPTAITLPLVFLIVIGSFLGTSIFARHASSEIADVSERLATNVSPSIEDLASVRGSVLEAELALARLLGAGEATAASVHAVQRTLVAVRSAVQEYLVLPLAPGEHRVHEQIQQAWLQFAAEARYVRERAVAGDFEQARVHMRDVEASAEALVRASIEAIEFNAKYGQLLAREIGESRRRAEVVAGGLTALSVVLGLIGGALLYRQARRRHILASERARALEERAEELEQFAGRVAHDIRGPLGAASLAVNLLSSQDLNENADNIVARLERNLGRASAITTGLLQFARAGAKPDPGARTSPKDAIADVRDDLESEAAKHNIELVWREIPLALAACHQGVYLSLLGNLVRNAIKYMGESTTRRIVVNVVDDGEFLRTEVTDTGPGIPDREQGSLFDPYFRGNKSTGREGLGLGLPTVRKLAKGHGGSAGVSSKEGSGSKFWFTLPRAGSPTTDVRFEYSGPPATGRERSMKSRSDDG